MEQNLTDDLMSLLLDLDTSLVLLVDERDRVIEAGKGLASLVGELPESLKGRRAADVLNAQEAAPGLAADLAAARAGRTIPERRHNLAPRPGLAIPVRWKIAPAPSAGGSIVAVIGSIDVESASVGSAISAAIHKLRNLLVAVQCNASLLQQALGDTENRALADEILGASEEAVAISETLRGLAKLGAANLAGPADARANGAAPPQARPAAAREGILLVDADAEMSQLLQSGLAALSIESLVVGSLEQASATLARGGGRIRAVALDEKALGESPGARLAAWRAEWAGLPMIVLRESASASASQQRIPDVRSIHRPFRVEELAAMLREAMGRA